MKVTLRIKRRYLSLADNSVELVNDFVDKCSDVGETNKKPDFDGKLISIVISPKKQTSKKKAQPKVEAPASEEVKEENN